MYSVLFIDGVNGFGSNAILPVSRPIFSGLTDGVSKVGRTVPLPFTGVTGMGVTLDASGSPGGRLQDGSGPPRSEGVPTGIGVTSTLGSTPWSCGSLLEGLGSFCGETVTASFGECKARNHRMTPR